jgi:hypothetical protein
MDPIKELNILSVDFDWVVTLKHQQELLTYLFKNIDTNKDIIFSNNHIDMYSLFKHGFNKINLINIDHHHDYFYNNDELNDGNWLYHLSKIYKINYQWICNNDSLHIKEQSYKKNLKSYSYSNSLLDIQKLNFDIYFMCSSPDFNNPIGMTSYEIVKNIFLKGDKNDNNKPN